MEIELWKSINNYDDYLVSNLGRIKSLQRTLIRSNGMPNIIKEKILKNLTHKNGYLYINLYKNKKSKVFYIHKLVAMAFLNHIPNGHKSVVDHIDNDKNNNRLENLQIITNRENLSKDKKGYTSEYVGVCWKKREKKWISKIYKNGKIIILGYFHNEYDAHLAYQKELKKITN